MFKEVIRNRDASDLSDPALALYPWTIFTRRWLAAATAAAAAEPGSSEEATVLRAATEVWEAIEAAIQADLPTSAAAALLASAGLCSRLPASCHHIAGRGAATARTQLDGGQTTARAAVYALRAAVAALHATDWDIRASALAELQEMALSASSVGKQCAAAEVLGALAAQLAGEHVRSCNAVRHQRTYSHMCISDHCSIGISQLSSTVMSHVFWQL